jgi:SPP1 gp7 family putative phage head morphogenesis protein
MLDDPTKTVALRSKAIKEIAKRFNLLKKLINETIIKNVFFANIEALDPDRFVYATDSVKIKEFELWLKKAIAEIIFDNQEQVIWLNKLIDLAYTRGISFALAALEANAPEILGITSDKNLNYVLALTPQQRFLLPAHIDKVRYIYSRVYTDLKNVTETMAAQIQKELTDGVLNGLNPRVVAGGIVKKVDTIGKVRANLIARTEIVNASHQAKLVEGDNYQAVTGEAVKYKWRTSQDERVRSTHAARHNKIYTKQQVIPLLGEPNCRCGIFLHFS